MGFFYIFLNIVGHVVLKIYTYKCRYSKNFRKKYFSKTRVNSKRKCSKGWELLNNTNLNLLPEKTFVPQCNNNNDADDDRYLNEN